MFDKILFKRMNYVTLKIEIIVVILVTIIFSSPSKIEFYKAINFKDFMRFIMKKLHLNNSKLLK